MNLLGTTILLVSLVMIFARDRQWALIGVMVGVLYLTQGQRIDLFGFNLYAVRFVELAAFIRVVHRKEFNFSRLTRIDKTLLLLFAYTTLVFSIRSKTGQTNKIGEAVDAYLCYFAFRGLLGGVEDFKLFLRRFLILLIPYAFCVIFESLVRYNIFSSMGSVIYNGEAWVRGGRLRAQGTFRQASLLGTLGAGFLPFYIGLWFTKELRRKAIYGIVTSMSIVWASNSGGPAMSAAVALSAWSLWYLRANIKAIRWALLGCLLLLSLTMDAPIWYLLAKLGSLTGGSGWHRARVIDMAFQHIDKWWMAGMPIKDTADWIPYVLSITGGADITNQYLAYGIDAGLAAMMLFIYMLYQSFRQIGYARQVTSLYDVAPSSREALLWGAGVMLTVNCFNWLSITYFDQTYVVWYFQLALIVNLSQDILTAQQNSLELDCAADEQPVEPLDGRSECLA